MNTFIKGMYSSRAQFINQIIALILIVFFATALAINVGLPTMIIVVSSATIGFFCWRVTNLRQAITPTKTATLFLLTVASLHVHMIEEHACLFGPAMSRLFNFAFPESKFLTVFVFILPVIYYLTAIGLMKRIPLAGFVAWFIFIGPGTAEFTHFIFPLIQPALEPNNLEPISTTINDIHISGMENHYYAVTGKYYFPGLYTAVLPMIFGSYSIWWLFKNRHQTQKNEIVDSSFVPAESVI